MSRKRRDFVIVSHCLLNPHSRVHILGKQFNLPKQICSFLLSNNVAIIQLPCPEFMAMGYIRIPQGKKQNNNIMFRQLCNNLIEQYILMVEELIQNNHHLLAYLGIQGSPTCSIHWGKHKTNKYQTESMIESDSSPNKYPEQLGVLSEILYERLESLHLDIPFLEVPVKEPINSPIYNTFFEKLNNIFI